MVETVNFSEVPIDLGGTLRARKSEETLAWLKPMLKHFGITRVADIGGLDKIGIPIATAIRPNAKHLCGAQGKGFTKELARISAIMEAIESAHMETPPTPNLIGNYETLSKTRHLIDPNILTPGKLEVNLRQANIGWVQCEHLISKEAIYVPHALVNISSSEIHPAAGYFSVTTNGLATGNTTSEAICHALYEVIERDAVSRWLKKSQGEKDKTQLNLYSIHSTLNQTLIRKCLQGGVSIEIWQLPAAISIPVYYCILYDTKSLGVGGVFYGSGCHPVKEIALSRAISEAIQSRVTFISGSRDDIYPRFYEIQKQAQKQIVIEMQQQETKKQEASFRYENLWDASLIKLAPNFTDNILTVTTALQEKGCDDVLVFHHTRPPFYVPVVQIFVPKLKNFFGGRQ